MSRADWTNDVLGFWFGELTPEDWYSGKKETDAACRDRFLDLYRELSSGVPPEARSEPDASLAAIILFDQIPRNIFRGTPEAFATDDIAVDLARNALDRGFDERLPPERKQFMYMPLMHSEVLADQERCVLLFRELGNQEGLRYAIEHRDIIQKYGRFPHRNRVLGRESTPAEVEFLKGHAGYGQ